MKYYTLLLLLVVTILGCSKTLPTPNTLEPKPEPEIIEEVDTTLAGKLKLKITDKQDLVLNKKIFEDSEGNMIIEGKKLDKHWIGCFDKSGNEVQVKVYIDDPKELSTVNDNKIPLNYYSYHQITEINGIIYILRRILKDNLEDSKNTFVQDFTKVNILAKKIVNEYITVYGDIPYIQQVTPWYDNFYRISTYRFSGLQHITHLTTIYSASDVKVAEFETFTEENSISDYVAISDERFVNIKRNGILQCWDYAKTDLFYECRVFASGLSKVTIDSMKLINGVVEIRYTTTNSSGEAETITVKMNPTTGKVI